MNVVIIPGNPPASFYYKMWIDELKLKYPYYNFHFLSFPYLNNTQEPKQYFQDLLDSIGNQIEGISGQIILIGHSIGGNFAYRLTDMYAHKVLKTALIFPFFGKPSFKGKLVLDFAYRLNKSDLIFNKASKYYKKLKVFNRAINDIEMNEIQAAVRLGYYERILMKKEFEIPELSKENDSKITGFYNLKDDWCTKECVKSLRQRFSTKMINAEHDFVLCPLQRNNVTKGLDFILSS